MLTTCPHCSKEINISTKKLNKFGFVENSKGDFISNLITKNGISLIEIAQSVEAKFPNASSMGRILRVINTMKNGKHIYQKGNKYLLNEVK